MPTGPEAFTTPPGGFRTTTDPNNVLESVNQAMVAISTPRSTVLGRETDSVLFIGIVVGFHHLGPVVFGRS